MASNFLSFLGGAAKQATKKMEAWDKIDADLKKAAFAQSLEAYSEDEKKFKNMRQLIESGMSIPMTAAQMSGVKWDDLSSAEKQEFDRVYGTEQGQKMLLEAYKPGPRPNHSNYKSFLGDHPLKARIKEAVGLTPNTAYARQNEMALVNNEVELPPTRVSVVEEGSKYKNIMKAGDSIVGIKHDDTVDVLHKPDDGPLTGDIDTIEAMMNYYRLRGETIPEDLQENFNLKHKKTGGKTTYNNFIHPDTKDKRAAIPGSERAEQFVSQGYLKAGEFSLNRDLSPDFDNVVPAKSVLDSFVFSMKDLDIKKGDDNFEKMSFIKGVATTLQNWKDTDKEDGMYTAVAFDVVNKYSKLRDIEDDDLRWQTALRQTLVGIEPGSKSIIKEFMSSAFGKVKTLFVSEGGKFTPKTGSGGDIKTRLRASIPQSLHGVIASGIYRVKVVNENQYQVLNDNDDVVHEGNIK